VPAPLPRYDPAFDSEFSASFSGLAWPRAAVAGGSLWHFLPALDPTSAQFTSLVINHNARLMARVNATCPNGCTCDWNSRCVSVCVCVVVVVVGILVVGFKPHIHE
jgi:hypothetical protein